MGKEGGESYEEKRGDKESEWRETRENGLNEGKGGGGGNEDSLKRR